MTSSISLPKYIIYLWDTMYTFKIIFRHLMMLYTTLAYYQHYIHSRTNGFSAIFPTLSIFISIFLYVYQMYTLCCIVYARNGIFVFSCQVCLSPQCQMIWRAVYPLACGGLSYTRYDYIYICILCCPSRKTHHNKLCIYTIGAAAEVKYALS